MDNELYEGHILMEQGRMDHQESDIKGALLKFSRALEIYQRCKDDKNTALALRSIGIMHDIQGQYDQALNYFYRAVVLQEVIQDTENLGRTLGNIGIIYQEKGDLDKALTYYKRSVTLCESSQDETLIIWSLSLLASLLSKKKSYLEAEGIYMQMLAFHQRYGAQGSEGVTWGNMGTMFYEQGDWSKAKEMLKRAVKLCDGIIVIASGLFRGTLGSIYAKEGNFEKALEYTEKAIELVSSEPQRLGRVLCSKTQILLQMNNKELAHQTLLEAKNIATSLSIGDEAALVIHIKETEALF